MFVLNHVSWLDIFLLDAVLPVTFVAKSEIGDWPLVGTLVTHAGTLYIERGSKSAARRTSERVAEALREQRPVAIFPEGTTSHGESVQRFHAALFQPAVDTASTIVPVRFHTLQSVSFLIPWGRQQEPMHLRRWNPSPSPESRRADKRVERGIVLSVCSYRGGRTFTR